MAILIGSQYGPYKIIALLGTGGMGKVYRARDTHLDRDVAIKVLPDETLAHDRERIQRFEREAKLLASLNHPNIAQVFGFVALEAKQMLVLEFVQGETLGNRLKRGAFSVNEALDIGKKIAEAMETAHERGIIHRDLKPSNVMITPDGAVKVLDFGLAKSLAQDSPISVLTDSPTVTSPCTRAGVIFGTAAYMSPEQARGRPADKRTDVWSFGVLLFECFCAIRPFEGETISDLIVQILEREPDYGFLPSNTPSAVRLLLRRCLAKDRNKRLRDFGDIRIEIEESSAVARAETGPSANLAGTVQERDIFRFIVNALLPQGNLQVTPPVPAAGLKSMTDVHEALQYLLAEYASPGLLPDDVAYFAYRMNRPVPMTTKELEQLETTGKPKRLEWAFQMAICNRQRGACRPGLKMHDRSNIARVFESGLADPYAHKADAAYEDRNQTLIGERFFRAYPVKVTGASVGVVGLSAGSTTDDQLVRFGRMGNNLSQVFGLIFDVFARRILETDPATQVCSAIADFYDVLLPKSQIP